MLINEEPRRNRPLVARHCHKHYSHIIAQYTQIGATFCIFVSANARKTRSITERVCLVLQAVILTHPYIYAHICTYARVCTRVRYIANNVTLVRFTTRVNLRFPYKRRHEEKWKERTSGKRQSHKSQKTATDAKFD